MALQQLSVLKQFLTLVPWRTQLQRMVFELMQNSVRGQSSLGNAGFTDFFSPGLLRSFDSRHWLSKADGLRLLNIHSAHLTQPFAVLPGYIKKSIN